MNVRLFSAVGRLVIAGASVFAGCSSSDDSSEPAGGASGKGGAGTAGSTVGGSGGVAHAGSGGTSTSGGGGATSGGTGGGSTGGVSGGGTTGGTGGATVGGTGGTGGAKTGGTGGILGEAGDDGEGGEGGATAPAPCGGCAVLTVPLTAAGQGTNVQTALSNPVDLTGADVTIRACVEAGDVHSKLAVFQQDDGTYAGDYATALYASFDTISACSVGMQDLKLKVVVDGTFTPTTVKLLTLQIIADGTTGPWVTSTLRIDSISATGDAIGPWPFTSNASAFAPNGTTNVAGSTFTWLR